ncbi:DNA processing protein [Haloferula luteola]|uniref:DNA processing protein n=1 Tax=Haloferula luteola TaxID=595692 RepID=A0A840VLX0_9BACT|nr:DNA-processing protein DprA [Haloferula luteola]MBB5353621.1 DNA processing protein [Haloferula luteola]
MHEALLALNALPRIGPVRIRRLLAHFGTARAVLDASIPALLRVEGIGPELANMIRDHDSLTDPSTELAELHTRGLSLLTPDDPAFPPALRESYDCPILLYVWGEVLPCDRHAIGIVGTRRASYYGKNSTKKLAYQLARSGFTILSGLARGIDTTAHEAALAASGRTVAIIGSGLARIYPAENLTLAEKIADGNGAVISEFPLHTQPDKQTFPQRNRIVAAWSRALVVTESPHWSGSLITANLATEYGRPVYAVPGPIDKPTSAGCHQLIREGATLLTDASELMDDMGALGLPQSRPSHPPTESTCELPLGIPDLPPEEQHLLSSLGDEESGIDRLVDLTGWPAQKVSTTLLKLEMKRLIRALPGMRYIRR